MDFGDIYGDGKKNPKDPTTPKRRRRSLDSKPIDEATLASAPFFCSEKRATW